MAAIDAEPTTPGVRGRALGDVVPVGLPPVRVRDLVYAKWRTMRNFPKSAREGGWLRLTVMLTLGAAVWLGIYGASHWFIGQTLALEPFGEILVRKILSMAFIVIFAILSFSNLISAFSTFLLADELSFLVARPLPARTLFTSRWLENALYASWMVLLFGSPLFLAAGVQFSAPAGYYAWLGAVAIPFVAIPPSLAAIVVVVLANLMPVERTREVFLGIGVIAFVAVFVLLRQLQPEQLFKPDAFGSTMEFFATLQTPGRYWLPSSWATELVYPALSADAYHRTSWLHVACLYASAAGLYFVAAWTFAALHTRAYSRSQQGRATELGGDPRAAGRDQARTVALARIRTWTARQSRRAGEFSPLIAIAVKDLRVFVRDTVQWSQLLLLAGLVVIYLVNISYVSDFGRGGIFGPVGIYFLNMGLSGFLVAAVSVRLVFPAVSLEGKAFWLVRRAPISLDAYLRAKWLGHTPNLLVLAEVLTVLSNWTLGTPWWLTVKSVLLIGLLSVGLTGLGVGMGAMFPRFHIDNAAKIATGIGGVLFMLIAIGLTLAIIAVDAWPTFHLMKHHFGFSDGLPDAYVLKATLAWSGVAVACLGSAWLAIRLGARRLRER